MADTDQQNMPRKVASSTDYEGELKAANEIVYRHSLELARLTKELEAANAAQENLLHFISHEVKGYLTKSEAGFAASAEGDFDPVTSDLKTMANMALTEVRKGVNTVMDILEAANMKKGTVSYKKEVFDFGKAVETIVDELKVAAHGRSLTLDFRPSAEALMVNGDQDKIVRHV